jgi:GTP-binding protein HflX
VAIVVGVRLPDERRENSEESLEELAALARAGGAEVAGQALQSRSRIDGRTYIGVGKAAELKQSARELGANLIVFDHDLSPAQALNLERITDLKVVDRTELILDIFARRARTPQARIQVEVAQLEYLLPRLTRLWEHLSRLGGGIGTRGPGETQLEVDRRRIRERLTRLRRQLATVGRRRVVQRRLHADVFRVALVGYTNSGKSSLMNRLTRASVAEGSRPFETLDATTRVLALGPGTRATLTDTVGFVRKLPHGLVASFRATLAEIAEADLLLHVVDAAAAHAEARRQAVESVLREIDAGAIPQIVVHNKCDLVSPEELEGLRRVRSNRGEAVPVSALTGEGLDELREVVRDRLQQPWIGVRGVVPLGEGELLARLRAVAEIHHEETTPKGVKLAFRIAPGEWGRLQPLLRERAPDLAARTGRHSRRRTREA